MKIFDLNFDVEEEPIPDGEDHDLLENIMDGEEVHDSPREKVKTEKEYYRNYVRSTQWVQKLILTENRGFNKTEDLTFFISLWRWSAVFC